MYKVGILIPTTTNGKSWKTIEETYLYTYFFLSFLKTRCINILYTIYLGIESDDFIYGNKEELNKIVESIKNIKNVSLELVYLDDVETGYLTKMWNILCKKAYDDNCDYFYQCGDDIDFLTKNWTTNCIEGLKKQNNIGLTGPFDINRTERGGNDANIGSERFIQTQSFVSKKHFEIFGFFFPEEIKNWCCDDWITYVYFPKYFIYLPLSKIRNSGDLKPRYIIESHKKKYIIELIKRDRLLLEKYINKQESEPELQ